MATYTPSNRGVYYVANYTPSNRGVFFWLMTPLQIGGYLFGQTIPLQIGGYVFGQTTPLRIEGYFWGQTAPLQHQNPSLLKPPLSPSPAIPKRARSPNGACADDFVPGRALGRALACLTALCRSFPLSCRARTAHLWQVVSPQKAPPPFPSLRPCNPLWVQRFKVVQHVKTEDQSPNVPLQRHLELTRTSVWLAFKQAWWIPATRCDPAPSVDLGAGLRVTQLAVPKLCAISLWF